MCENHSHGNPYIYPAISFILLATGMAMSWLGVHWFANRWIELGWYIVAFLPVGIPVMREAAEGIAEGEYFNEFTLMSVACIGAFCIGEYAEAVGVMLFYSIGETLQDKAVDRATDNISRLMALKADKARVVRGDAEEIISPGEVRPGESITVYPGERVPLDGKLIGRGALFDTSALTGESLPREIEPEDEVAAGMIPLQSRVRLRVTREYGQSAFARIIEMVNEASERKAHTELFIRKFARIYTPAVLFCALLVVTVPFIVSVFDSGYHYEFSTWLKRALVFLVISCPCALVISVPLGYFAGIGAASRSGILFKGGNFLDAIASVKQVAFDKTGTLTTGSFHIDRIESPAFAEEEFLSLLAGAESFSSHPLARTLIDYVSKREIEIPSVSDIREFSGFGVTAHVGSHNIVAGNDRMLKREGIEIPHGVCQDLQTVIICAVDGKFAGWVSFSDEAKAETPVAISRLKTLGVERVAVLSGDNTAAVKRFAESVGVSESYGDLLPEDKVRHVEELSGKGRVIFVGDGINDSPVLAAADVGIAMGAAGSDLAVETADVVIVDDSPAKVATAIRIGRFTRKVIKENIIGAIAVKLIVMGLGLAGIATLWAAVFADVGVALLAVTNALRIFSHNYGK